MPILDFSDIVFNNGMWIRK